MALMPLRIFLGGTFVYAGVQKLSDPGFLHPGAPTYIGTQLHGFAEGTPGGFVLHAFALPMPEVAGVGVALAEILIGLLVLAGLYTRAAAAAGMGLNLLLFLTASWHTTPYFLGPDLVFAFAWSALVIGGAEGQPSIDQLFAARSRRRRRRPDSAVAIEPVLGGVSTRRALLLEAAGAAAAVAGVSFLLRGGYSPPRALGSTAHGGGHKRGDRGGSSSSSTSSSTSANEGSGGGAPQGGVRLGPASALPAGEGATYADPADGAPDIIIRAEDGTLTAFSAVCTHAGCTVGYEAGTIICPCHGGEYDPQTGAVIAGPPPSGLEPKKVVEAGGQIYAVPS